MELQFSRLRSGLAASALGISLLATPMLAVAQDATPAASPGAAMPLPANCTVVASGLINPRDISFGSDGTLFIAEAGDGGTDPDFATPMAGTPETGAAATTHGSTGRVSMIAPDGTWSVVADGLTSYVFGTELIGPSGVVATDDGKLYVSVGGPGGGLAGFDPAGNAGHVVSIDLATGAVTDVADLAAFEKANNPDPAHIDSDLSDLTIGSDGLIYVNDAGGNDTLTVDPATGEIKLLAVIPALPTADGSGNEERGGAAEVDPVPTGILADADGGVYVGLLTGAALWGVPGSGKILHIAADGTVTDVATGGDTIVGLAQASDGTIYASEFSTNMFADAMPAPGRIVMVGADGVLTSAIEGLPFPYGIAFGPDGSLYVALVSSVPPGTPASGMIAKCSMAM